MATATVSYTDYQEGRLPPICVISGEPTTDRFTYRTVIAPSGGSDGIVGRIETFIATVNPGAPRNMLLGRIPVDADVHASLRLRRTGWTVALVVSIAALLVAAWSATAWSPYLAVAAIVGIATSVVKRRETERALPIPELTHGGSWVTLRNVHERFAAAAETDTR